MCNFVPNECLAVAPRAALETKLLEWHIPGRVQVLPLAYEDDTLKSHCFESLGVVHVVDIPDGLELLVASKLSAALAEEIASGRAVVELNYLLPLGAPVAHALEARSAGGAALSEAARTVADWIRAYPDFYQVVEERYAHWTGKVALLDSGLRGEILLRRRVAAYDYVQGRATPLQAPGTIPDDHDVLGHGTRVATILDAALPDEVALASGRIARDQNHVTVLQLARAYAHLVAKEGPDVVNVSAAPRDDQIACPGGHPVTVPAFHSNILPFVFEQALPATVTVMAAGNAGRPSNARFVLPGTTPPVFAVAIDSAGQRAPYSNYVVGDGVTSIEAFGGDDPSSGEVRAVFQGHQDLRGTSYAAPFVSAFVYKFRRAMPPNAPLYQDLGLHRRDLATLIAS